MGDSARFPYAARAGAQYLVRLELWLLTMEIGNIVRRLARSQYRSHNLMLSSFHLLAGGRIHSSERRTVTKDRQAALGYDSERFRPQARDFL